MSAPKPSPYDPAYVSEVSLDRAARALCGGDTDGAARLSRATHGLHQAIRSRPEFEWTVERRLGALEQRLEAALERLHRRIDAIPADPAAGPGAPPRA
jgi:hypothetical protein